MNESRQERGQRQREHIAAAAHRLFVERGFERTSYQDIAAAAGVDRSLVQYYFPKKDGLILGLMDLILRTAENAARAHSTGADVFVQLHLVAQVYFGFLLDPPSRPLTRDIVASRRLTDEVILFDEDWLRERLDLAVSAWPRFSDDMTMAVGGAYELCYQAIAHGRELDARDLSRRLLLAFMASAGKDHARSRTALSAFQLEDEPLREAIAIVRSTCLSGGETQ